MTSPPKVLSIITTLVRMRFYNRIRIAHSVAIIISLHKATSLTRNCHCVLSSVSYILFLTVTPKTEEPKRKEPIILANYGRCTISSGSLNVRSSANSSASVVFTLAKDEVAVILGSTGTWYQISHPKGTGYCSMDYMSILGTSGTSGRVNLSSGNLNVRTGPASTFTLAFTLANNTQVTILSTLSGWCLITGTFGTGWCSADYIATGTINGPNYGITLEMIRQGGVSFKLDLTTQSNDIRLAQQMLCDKGYYVSIDGIYGYATESAVVNFQNDQGLTADGKLGKGTLAKLETWPNSGVTLDMVRAGTAALRLDIRTYSLAVRDVQLLLIGRGYSVPVDGYFGYATEAAVINFQNSSGLTSDGICGRKTLAKLEMNGGPNNGVTLDDVRNGHKVLKMDTDTKNNAAVMYIQSRLKDVFKIDNSLVIDGCYGPGTERAVREFQMLRDEMSVDGIVGQVTLSYIDSIFSGPNKDITVDEVRADAKELRFDTLSPTEYSVQYVQEKLSGLGYSVGSIDGVYGRRTREAVTNFQMDEGLLSSYVYNAPSGSFINTEVSDMNVNFIASSATPRPTTPGRTNSATLRPMETKAPVSGSGYPRGSNKSITLSEVRDGSKKLVPDWWNENGSIRGTVTAAIRIVQNYLRIIAAKDNIPTLKAAADGVYGRDMTSIVKKFQALKSITETGIVDAQTLSRMESIIFQDVNAGVYIKLDNGLYSIVKDMGGKTQNAMFEYNPYYSTSPSSAPIVTVQTNLKRYFPKMTGYRTGIFDEITDIYTRRFQYEKALLVDGAMGTNTYRALIAACNSNETSTWELSFAASPTRDVTRSLMESAGMKSSPGIDKIADLASGIKTHSINANVTQLALFLGQCIVESAYGRYLVEQGTAAYLQSKDYYPWIGAGFIQLTGSDNYTAFYGTIPKPRPSASIAVDEVASTYPGRASAYWWGGGNNGKGLNECKDKIAAILSKGRASFDEMSSEATLIVSGKLSFIEDTGFVDNPRLDMAKNVLVMLT